MIGRNNNKKETITAIDNKIETKKSFNPFKKLKKKFKVIIFLSTYLILFITIALGATCLIYDNKFSYSNSNFNPDGNLGNWITYYNKHKKDHKLIDLTKTEDFLKHNKITLSVTDSNHSVTFDEIVKNIDKQLKVSSPQIEANDISNDNDSLLPSNFFANVIYNPAVNFTVLDNKQEVSAETYLYSMGDKYGVVKEYSLKMDIDASASNFGININQNTTIDFTVDITNKICFDLKNLSVNFENQTFSTDKDKAKITLKQMLKNFPDIDKYVRKTFTDALATELPTKDIPENSYNITYSTDKPNTTPLDFNTGVNVKIAITANDSVSKRLGFTGTLENQTINIKNIQIDLSKLDDLKKQITDSYKDKPLDVSVTNDAKNDDTNLSQTQVNQVNQEISDQIKAICQSYFKKYYKDLDIKTTDYDVMSNLETKANIFQQKNGLKTNISISPSKDTQKFAQSSDLKNIDVTVRGKNETSKKVSWKSPDGCKPDGIIQGDKQDTDILQDGDHKYEQTTLLQYLVTNSGSDPSFLNYMKDNSYQDPTNFTGTISINGTLDGSIWLKPKKIDISTISNKSTGINNLYELLNKTTGIELETNVGTTSGNRTLDNVKFNFLTGDSTKTVIYTLDLTDLFNGIAIQNEGTSKLIFTEFKINTTYDQFN